MSLLKAEKENLPDILDFYHSVIDHTENMERYARWKKGMHPSIDTIKEYLDRDAMYLYMDHAIIVGAMAVTMEQGSDYHKIAWEIKAEDHEVAVVHILGVNADYQGQGIGKRMVDAAIQLARDNHKKAIRLDALASNIPAQHMYEEKGFVLRGTQNLYAENTGWTDFLFYERVL